LALEAWHNEHSQQTACGLLGTFAASACPEVMVCVILHAICAQQAGVYLDFDLVSGSAMGVDREGSLRDRKWLTFRATVLPSEALLGAILDYFRELDPREKTLALLVESNTELGQSVPDKPPAAAAPNASQAPAAADSQVIWKGYRVLRMPFPLHIARLRALVDRERRRWEERLGLATPDPLIPRLVDSEAGADEFPAQDPAITASVNGKQLKSLLSAIDRERARYVGIVATDPRDKVFLISAIRERCPDVRIFTTSADNLLTLPEYAYYVKGTFIATTYPLLPENQRWTAPLTSYQRQRVRFAFPSQSAQGHFNAVLAQRGQGQLMVEYRPPRFDGQARSQEVGRPPVWVSMVGAGGDFVPLQFSDPAALPALCDRVGQYMWPPPDKTVTSEDVPMDLRFPGTDVLALLTFLALCVAVVLRDAWSGCPLVFWQRPDRLRTRTLWEGYCFRLTCFLALLSVAIPVAVLCSIAASGMQDRAPRWLLLASLPWFAVAWLAVALFLSPLRPAVGPGPAGAWEAGAALTGVTALPFVAPLAWYWAGPLTAERALYCERTLDFSSGASCLMPLLFMAAMFFLWAFFHLKRIYLAGRFSCPCPYPGLSADRDLLPLARIRQRDRQLRCYLEDTPHFLHRRGMAVLLLGAFVVVAGWRLWSLYLFLPEHPVWSWLFFVGFAAGFSFIAIDILRFWTVWSSLKGLLNQVVLLPMTETFDRLPYKARTLFGGHLYSVRPRLTHLALPMHQLRLLEQETDRLLQEDPPLHFVATNRPCLEAVHRRLRGLLKNYEPQKTGDDAEQISWDLRDGLAELAMGLVPLLHDAWRKRTADEAFGDDPTRHHPVKDGAPATPASADALDHWVGLAEDFVATDVVLYASQFFVQLRNQVWSLVVCSLLLLLGTTAYPFNVANFILLSVLVLLTLVVGSIVAVLYQINVNEFVSRVTGTTPHRFTPDAGFLTALFTYVVPAVVVVSIQLSGSFRYLLEPILRVFK
jgi:hypothetical protein